jgi:hypothetical protein
MGFIRFLIWTSMCIALGIFVASWEIDGRTPLQHMRQIWKGVPVETVKKKLAAPNAAPTETHSAEDKDAINRLVAKRAK